MSAFQYTLWGLVSLAAGTFWDVPYWVGYLWCQVPSVRSYTRVGRIHQGVYQVYLAQVLTSSDGHRSGSTYHTGMLFSFVGNESMKYTVFGGFPPVEKSKKTLTNYSRQIFHFVSAHKWCCNIFTGVCLFTGGRGACSGRGVCFDIMLSGREKANQVETPERQTPRADTSYADTTPWADTTLRRQTVNKREVPILLECILVWILLSMFLLQSACFVQLDPVWWEVSTGIRACRVPSSTTSPAWASFASAWPSVG